jgi:Ca-activated chloride channel family protein
MFLLFTGLLITSYIRKKRIVSRAFSDSQKDFLLSNFSMRARIFRIIMLGLALFFISISLLDPRWGTVSSERKIEGIDIVIAFDVSQSMMADDIKPNRLEYAKRLTRQLFSLLIGNRVGVVGFAGYGFPVMPLTTDINAIMMFLDSLSVDMVDVQGTNIEDALREAMKLFEREALTHKAVILISDGEDTEFNPLSQAREAAERGISIFTLGIGSIEGGYIPLYDERGGVAGYLEKEGQVVLSTLDDRQLREIAKITGAEYFYGSEASVISLARRIDEIKKSPFGTNIRDFMNPQYQLFLLTGILLLLIYVWFPERRININLRWFAVLAVLFFVSNPLYGKNPAEGVREYRAGNYTNALEIFRNGIISDPDNERLRFNEGNAYYQLEEFARAVNSYSRLTNSGNKDVRARSRYNMGNAYLEKGDIDGALSAYRDVFMSEVPNSEIVKKALNNFLYAKQMQQQQQQQSQTSPQGGDGDNEERDDDTGMPDSDDDLPDDGTGETPPQRDVSPISPSDIENLLGLIEEEEKRRLSELKRRGDRKIYPKQPW